jgi:hypothetical protein
MHHASCAVPPLDPEMVQVDEVTLKVLASPSTALIFEDGLDGRQLVGTRSK